MSHGAHYAKEIPLEVQKRVAEYGHGLLADWVPQQALLEHPVSKLVHLITYVLAIRTKNFILGDGMVYLAWWSQQCVGDNQCRHSNVSIPAPEQE